MYEECLQCWRSRDAKIFSLSLYLFVFASNDLYQPSSLSRAMIMCPVLTDRGFHGCFISTTIMYLRSLCSTRRDVCAHCVDEGDDGERVRTYIYIYIFFLRVPSGISSLSLTSLAVIYFASYFPPYLFGFCDSRCVPNSRVRERESIWE